MIHIVFPESRRSRFDYFYKFQTYRQLVNYLSGFNEIVTDEKGTHKDNTILRRSGIGTDSFYGLKSETVEIYDDNRVTLYSKGLWEDVLSWEWNEEIEKYRTYWVNSEKRKIMAIRKLHCNNLPEFRRGPVPRTGAPRYFKVYRRPRCHQALQEAENTEFARKRHIVTVYDDLVCSRWRSRSWKDTTKDARQWMRGVRNGLPSRGKGLYFEEGWPNEIGTEVLEIAEAS